MLKKSDKKDIKQRKITEKQSTSKDAVNKNIIAILATALGQGIVPHTYNDKLLAGLSRLGNYSFLKVLERNESTNRALKKYADDETLSAEKVGLLKETLSADSTLEVNEVDLMPVIDENRPIPALIGEESTCFSTLTPVPFDQGIIKT